MEVGISRRRVKEIVHSFASRSVLVLGDLMVDEYLRGAARRISPESPVMVIEVESDEYKPGGAANVVNNLLSLRARAVAIGVVGDDEGGRQLRTALEDRGADVSGILVDATRPTTRKTRIVAQNQQVLRVDREQTLPISADAVRSLVSAVEAVIDSVDAILVSDYRKGVLTPDLARELIRLAGAARKPLVANPKPGSAPWLAGARVLSLNQSEAEALTGVRFPEEEAAVEVYGAQVTGKLDAQCLVITRGSRGLSYWTRNGEYRHVPAHAVEVYDVAGAGDTTISALTLALVSGASDYEAAELANCAGACVVRKSGVATVSPEDLLGSL